MSARKTRSSEASGVDAKGQPALSFPEQNTSSKLDEASSSPTKRAKTRGTNRFDQVQGSSESTGVSVDKLFQRAPGAVATASHEANESAEAEDDEDEDEDKNEDEDEDEDLVSLDDVRIEEAVTRFILSDPYYKSCVEVETFLAAIDDGISYYYNSPSFPTVVDLLRAADTLQVTHSPELCR
ncbi:hypothetical protein LshimejAT787_0312150 [Lyophyllum shimeji]|uniref:Uncharacterized protein n=1 Tax=Lyophyllum shimeji TaxID=47721 RepID=A0A9P3PJ62_LYOSH|nr:hypothetical protein LshimejAT787_0312150 [Lyophyllum shimeji]